MENSDYTKMNLDQLYEYYRALDKEKNPFEAEKVLEIIKVKQQDFAPLEDNRLAERVDRFLASLVDGLIMMVPMLIFMFFYVYRYSFMELSIKISTFEFQFIIFAISTIIFLLVNGYLLYEKGQTVGKKLLRIKIVDMHNKLPSFSRVYLVRSFLVNAIGQIPFIGNMFAFIDILFIFRKDRRCLHDLIAETKVIVE